MASYHWHQAWVHLEKGAGHSETRHCIPTACKAQLLKESQVVLELCEEGSQGLLRVECVVFTRLRQIQI